MKFPATIISKGETEDNHRRIKRKLDVIKRRGNSYLKGCVELTDEEIEF